MAYVEYNGYGGNWNAGPWTNGEGTPTTPQPGDDVYLYLDSGEGTLTSSSNVAIGSLSIDTVSGYDGQVTLDIAGGVFAVGSSSQEAGALTIANYGIINVGTGATLVVATPDAEIVDGGIINLWGKLELASSTVLNTVDDGYLWLSSLGTIGSDGHDMVMLTNKGSIYGGGLIGDQYLTLNNEGTIDATASMILNTGLNEIVNAASCTMEASNGGFLNIHSNVYNEGFVEAQANSAVDLMNASINGGVVDISAGATLEAVSGVNTITGYVANQGSIQVENGATLSLTGQGVDNGSVTINGTGVFELSNAAAFDEKVSFAALSHGTMVLENATAAKAFNGAVYGFVAGDQIDLIGFGAHTTYSYSGGELHVNDVEGSVTHTANIDIVGSLTTASFHGRFNGSEVIFTHA